MVSGSSDFALLDFTGRVTGRKKVAAILRSMVQDGFSLRRVGIKGTSAVRSLQRMWIDYSEQIVRFRPIVANPNEEEAARSSSP